MTILLVGIDGYMGWPTALKLGQAFPDSRIVGVDNFNRRKWVAEVGSISAIPVHSMEQRLEAARALGITNLSFVEGDLTDYHFTRDLIRVYKPTSIVHTAAQPSAPYSHISAEKCAYTQTLVMDMTRNLLWALREEKRLETHYIETTTTGIYGAPELKIPEGFITGVDENGDQDQLPFPNMASSWYHVSKGFNATNMQLMSFQTGLPTTDMRTSIVYGAASRETAQAEALATRFDFDFYFGTLFNRWCVMALCGRPITVYGSGNQIKPLIHVEDAAESLVKAVQRTADGYQVYNQLTEYVRIGDLAQMIKEALEEKGLEVAVENIPNPRVEKESQHYEFDNRLFLELLGQEPQTMKGSLASTFELLLPYKDMITPYLDRMAG